MCLHVQKFFCWASVVHRTHSLCWIFCKELLSKYQIFAMLNNNMIFCFFCLYFFSEFPGLVFSGTSDSLSLWYFRKPTVLCVFIIAQVNSESQRILYRFLIFVQNLQKEENVINLCFLGIVRRLWIMHKKYTPLSDKG